MWKFCRQVYSGSLVTPGTLAYGLSMPVSWYLLPARSKARRRGVLPEVGTLYSQLKKSVRSVPVNALCTVGPESHSR